MSCPVAPERIRAAEIDRIRMRWEEHGRESGRPTLVMVHGLPTNPRVWRRVIPQLSDHDARLLAWEQPGFGGSLGEGVGRDLSIPAQAKRLEAWLSHLGIGTALFVGHDYGGGVVQQLAIEAPQRFAGLILVDCVAFDNWPVAAVRTAREMRALIGRLPPKLVYPLFRLALANLGHTDPKAAREAVELYWQPYRAPGGPAALAHQLAHFRSEQTVRIGERLRPLGCPTHVVWGERDPLGVASARKLAERLQAELHILPGAYHFTPEDEPEAVAGVTRRALVQVRTGI